MKTTYRNFTMSYQDLNIHQRINTKGNAAILCGAYFRNFQGYYKEPAFARIRKTNPGKYSPEILLQVEKFRYPKNDEIKSY